MMAIINFINRACVFSVNIIIAHVWNMMAIINFMTHLYNNFVLRAWQNLALFFDKLKNGARFSNNISSQI